MRTQRRGLRYQRFLLLLSVLLLFATPWSTMAGPAPAKPATKKALPPKPDLAPELKQRVDETLAEALASKDAVAQGTALAAMVDLGDAAAATRVDEALAEENWGIKRYALLIAGREDRATFYPAIAKVLENTTTRPLGFDLIEMLPSAIQTKVFQQAIGASEDSLRAEVVARLLDRGDEDALASINLLVTSKDAKLREEGLATFGKLTSPVGVRYLMKQMSNPDPELRRRAQEALLKSTDQQVKPFLSETLRKASDLRLKVEAAKALAGRGVRDDVLPVLKQGLDERDVEIRVLAMEGIAALGDRVTAAELRPLAVNPREDKLISTAALKVLGGTGDVANLETLREALNMDFIHLRIAAVEAMGDLRRVEAIPDLAQALHDGNPQVRLAAATSLGKIGTAAVVPPLQAAVEREVDAEVQDKIIESLGRSGAAEGVLALQVLLVHQEARVKIAAIHAVLEIGDPRTANTLLVDVDPREPEVMEAAIHAICLLDPNLGAVALKPNLRNVSLQLLHSLHAEAGPRGTSFLESFLVDGSLQQRSLALDLLLRRGAEGMKIVRTAATSNGDASIRRAALRALLVREDRESLEVFVKGLEDSDDGLRAICVEALGLLGDQTTHQEQLVKMLEDRAPSVRAAAAHALIRLATKPKEGDPRTPPTGKGASQAPAGKTGTR